MAEILAAAPIVDRLRTLQPGDELRLSGANRRSLAVIACRVRDETGHAIEVKNFSDGVTYVRRTA